MSTLPAPRALLTSLVNSIALTPLPSGPPPPSTSSTTHAAGTARHHHSQQDPSNASSNPFKLIPPSSRPLLATLHVLFPTLLLPALDLLDRSLVTRVTRGTAVAEEAGVVVETEVGSEETSAPGVSRGGQDERQMADNLKVNLKDPDVYLADQGREHHALKRDHAHSKQEKETKAGESGTAATATTTTHLANPASSSPIYLVRSAASISSKRNYNAFAAAAATTGGDGGGNGGISSASSATETPYIVRLDAWNCSCANFTFGAFPAPGVGGTREGFVARGEGGMEIEGQGEEDTGEWDIFDAAFEDPPDAFENQHSSDTTAAAAWRFGGMSFNDKNGLEAAPSSGAPCCKHLLACLLAERWRCVLGRYVVERRVSREEMAGLVANT